jgi:hypothetical protein
MTTSGLNSILLGAITVLALGACGGGGGSASSGDSAQVVADRLEESVGSVTKTVTITENNDPNNDIGRPGQYQVAVSIYDERVTCTEALDISCGAKVEVFDDEDAAENRYDYITTIVEEAGGLLTEYDYLDGTVLLRVSGELKPSEAEEYESAFKK